MTKKLDEILMNALGGMQNGPSALAPSIAFHSNGKPSAARSSLAPHVEKLIIRRVSGGNNDVVRELLHRHLTAWDYNEGIGWADGTRANTLERRKRIYERLRLSSRLITALDESLPPFVEGRHVIIENVATVSEWYSREFQNAHHFYWPRVRTYLEKVRGLSDGPLGALEASTESIVRRLADPASATPTARRGLIVGYVQSGKTTNFTGVIARAIDAGYRLIIVLSGTTNLLRNQTQRRLDMELVGVENILQGGREQDVDHDYKSDADWPDRFISFRLRPGLAGGTAIARLTGQQDFTAREVGINPVEFEFEKRDKSLPLFHRNNLEHSRARILVIKKQRDRLTQLLRVLRSIGDKQCSEIPTLIIDDESDQASINTVNPNKIKTDKRSKINDLLVKLLKKLPRAQYLGYTATPFANVFVDPTDQQDIYPRDFILSLLRPQYYMGAREFHDFQSVASDRMSNEAAHVRGIPRDGQPKNFRLEEAVDAYVLAGAIKQFRAKKLGKEFKHHTMLVHVSSKTADHRDTVDDLMGIWRRAAYRSPGPGLSRLRTLFADYQQVWLDRGKEKGLPFPAKFDDLREALGKTLTQIGVSDPILMVNSADGSEIPDFDGEKGVWKIIVGGAKLSRGYTIEGLTISYFRRTARMQDTLMQMGRWFGYRDGYHDLVRLYIGRAEGKSARSRLDLYKAFEAMCRDEEDFRGQLEMYATPGGITPQDVPALVFNSYPQLKPTAKNRMYHARLAWAAFRYREPTQQAFAGRKRLRNCQSVHAFLARLKVAPAEVKPHKQKGSSFKVFYANSDHMDVVRLLRGFAWQGDKSGVELELNFLDQKPSPIDRWLVVLPQLTKETEGGSWAVGPHRFTVQQRERFETRFGVFSTPRDLDLARWLVGEGEDSEYSFPHGRRTRTGVLLLYPTIERGTGASALARWPVMGFGLMLPTDGQIARRVAYTVSTKAKAKGTSGRRRR